MAGVRVDIDGSEAVLAFLGDAAARTANPRGLFDLVGTSLVASTQARFLAGAGPEGTPWPPSIRAIAEGGRTLIDSARLMQSVTHEASDAGVTIGTNVIYAAIHQFGGTIRPVSADSLVFRIGDRTVFAKSVEIPARPFLGIDDDDETEIGALAADWLLGEESGEPPQ